MHCCLIVLLQIYSEVRFCKSRVVFNIELKYLNLPLSRAGGNC